MCCVSLTTEILRSGGPQPSSVEPSCRLHSPKHATTYTPGWPVCRVQQVCVCVCAGYWHRYSCQVYIERCSSPCLSCPGNPLSLVDLVPLLQRTLKDESSVTCKMACSAVRVRHTGISSSVLCLGLSLTLWLTACVAALHHDSVQQYPERAGLAVGDRPAGSEGLVLLACSH